MLPKVRSTIVEINSSQPESMIIFSRLRWATVSSVTYLSTTVATCLKRPTCLLQRKGATHNTPKKFKSGLGTSLYHTQLAMLNRTSPRITHQRAQTHQSVYQCQQSATLMLSMWRLQRRNSCLLRRNSKNFTTQCNLTC